MNYQQRESDTNKWVATPLNRIGDLDSWINRMDRACPDPQLNQVVWLNSITYLIMPVACTCTDGFLVFARIVVTP